MKPIQAHEATKYKFKEKERFHDYDSEKPVTV